MLPTVSRSTRPFSVCALLAVAFGAALPLAAGQEAADSSTLRAGFASVDITPTRPTPMAGYYSARLSTETHDPLLAKATVLDDGQTKVAIVAVDLISTNKFMVSESRKLIADRTGIPADHVMISATHSHTGPVLFDPESSRGKSFGGDRPEAARYMDELPGKIADCVAAAADAMGPVTVKRAEALEPELGFNRRFFMTDGTVSWNPSKLNPRIIRPAGPTDDRLPFVAFYDADGQLVAIHANFSIHLDTVGGTQWSADMPHTFAKSLRDALGEQLHVQYTTGACGDINHRDVRTAMPQKGHVEASRIGTRLAAAVLRSIGDLEPAQGTKLQVTRGEVALPMAPHTPEDVEWSKDIAARADAPKPPAFMEMVKAFRVRDVERRDGEPIAAEVGTVTLGRDVAWVFLPGEIFVQLGMDIKAGSPFDTTMVPELAGGSVGYVPTRQAYPQGNYEVVSARVAAGSGEMLVDEALRQLMEHFQELAETTP